jgi:pyridoxal phosphate enzyme (YggS family)
VSQIAENLAAVEERLRAACQRSRREIGSVQLVAVSKLQPLELIRQAYAAGQRDFGENYAQELRDKSAALADLPGIRWHAIGPLQTNKAKYVTKVAHEFHALDRRELAEELARRRSGSPLRCYLEVNLGGETSKSGIPPERAAELLAQTQDLPGLNIVGLMGLPPLSPPEGARAYFRQLRRLAEQIGLHGLSMGTTLDFEIAVEEGATVVRVGTAIFGERPA